MITDFCSSPKVGFRGWVKCGKCRGCLKVRQNDWVRRAMIEFEAHPRTWFLTLTYRGEYEVGYDAVQKFLKRLRKNTGQKIRYLCATERGSKNNRLHYHLLVHGAEALTKRMIIKEWPHGLTHMRLARDLTSARYVSKYTAKDAHIRPSLGYGHATLELATQRLKEKSDVLAAVLAVFPDARVDKIAGKPIPYRLRLRRVGDVVGPPVLNAGGVPRSMSEAGPDGPDHHGTALLRTIDEGKCDLWGRTPLNPWFGIPPEGHGEASPE